LESDTLLEGRAA